MTSHTDDARRLLADALEIGDEEIADGAAIDTLDAWTSLGHMRLILAIEEKLGQQLDAADVVEIATLGDITALLERRVGG